MAEDIIEGTHPTRMELLRVKNKLRLAEKGHRLLKEKRDTLVREFMALAGNAGDIAGEASEQMERARHAYAVSAALAGSTQLVSASLATPDHLAVDVEYRKVMGIGLPKLAVEGSVGKLGERGYGIISTHPSVDAVASEYERAVGSMVKLAETESSLHALADEVGKTKRRVNALEYRVVPQLAATRRYIHMRLDELEREEFYRKKMVKGKKLRAEGEI